MNTIKVEHIENSGSLSKDESNINFNI